ncbi:MAG: MATE family efflux transporter, partial [Victivallaceae bacterium]
MLAFIPQLLKRYFGHAAFHTPGGYREVWHIAYPLIMMSATQTLMMFVDRKMLASHSTNEMAAALPAGILYFTLFCFFSVTANFTSALVAQFYGNKERYSCVKSVWSGVYLAAGFSLLIIFVNPL